MSATPFTIELTKPLAGASEDALDRFERSSGIQLPSDYRKFLSSQNGGAPKKRHVSLGTNPSRGTVLLSFFGVECPFEFDLGFAIKQYTNRIPANTMPIAIDEFDNLVLMSQDPGSVGRILFWDHEQEKSGAAPSSVASTLEEFLNTLRADKPVEREVATITFADGESCRRVLPARFRSLDRDAVIDVRDARLGERIKEFGVIKTIQKIEYSRENLMV
jgi:hypothetical protein